jgi:Fe-S-cluster containining protein
MRHLRVGKEAVDWTEQLHAAVSELTRPIAAANAARSSCREGCSGCCSDGLTVFEIEAAVIARRHPELLASGMPHEEGACAFLDDKGRCRIYDARPYVCRTQGLPLRWLDEDEEGEPFESRDICPLNEPGGPPLEELPADACWSLGPIEERLAKRQADVDGGERRRVALRSLFATSSSTKRRLEVLR